MEILGLQEGPIPVQLHGNLNALLMHGVSNKLRGNITRRVSGNMGWIFFPEMLLRPSNPKISPKLNFNNRIQIYDFHIYIKHYAT